MNDNLGKMLRIDVDAASPYGIRFSIHNYSIHDKIHSYPLYAVAGSIENKERLIKVLKQIVNSLVCFYFTF